jgi:hypothetical protein
MVHRAKVDWWLAALVGGAGLLVAAAGAAVLLFGIINGDPGPQAAIGIASILLGSGALVGLLLWGCYKTRYEVTPSELIVRFGPFSTNLPLGAIVEVFPTHNPLSAPAPSLDRLRINYRRKNGRMWFALISPKDKEAFVRDLASVAPRLRSNGPLRLRTEDPA